MSAVQEKRGDDNMTVMKHVDLPSANSAKKLHSVGTGLEYYCSSCRCQTDHTVMECPDRSHGKACPKCCRQPCEIKEHQYKFGKACPKCHQPCEIKEHQDKFKPMLKMCCRCLSLGHHWSFECPSPVWDEDDDPFF